MAQGIKDWWKKQIKGSDRSDLKTIVLALLLLLFSIIYLWIALDSKAVDVRFNNEEVSIFDATWQVNYKGENYSVTLPATIDASAGDTIVLTSVLDKESIQGNSLIFYARQSWVTVSLDEKVLVASEKNRKTPFDMTPGSYWYLFRLPDGVTGKTLKIELEPAMDRYAKELPTIYSGTKAAIIYMVLMQGRTSILLIVPVLFLGVGLLVISPFLNQRRMKRRFFRLGGFAVVTSLWSLLESRVTQLLFGDMVLASYVLFSCYYLIPVFAAAFLMTYPTLEKRKYMKGLFWVSATSFLLIQVLQITEITYYIQMVSVMHVLIALIFLGVIVSYIDLRRKREIIPDQSIYIGMFILGAFCIVDVINYYINPEVIVGGFSKVGILAFFGYLAYMAIRQVSQSEIKEAENRVYQRLAYVDMMTELSNRTAFERDLVAYREEPWKEETILMVGDMNRLKYINDKYGHAQGDKALKQIAELIKLRFNENCKCYRTGGDEFCVISRGIPEKQFAAMCKRFMRDVMESPQEADWMLSVSCGYCVVDESGIDECYRKADTFMYAEKEAYRRELALSKNEEPRE